MIPGPPPPPAAEAPPPGPGGAAHSVGHRLGFIAHLLVWGLGVLLIAILAGLQPALIVAVAWGIGLSVHGLFAVAAPWLRQRWEHPEPAPPVGGWRPPGRGAHEARSARALEELAASVAHEIRNPVAAARSLVQQVRDDPSAPENAEYLTLALEELGRVEHAVGHLLRFAREPAPALGAAELGQVARSALQGTAERCAAAGVRVEDDLEPGLTLQGDAEQLRRVVINLVQNAVDAAASVAGREPRVRLSAGRDLAGRTLWLRVTDNGPGITPAERERLFSPFHTSKAEGTGLGLAISRRVIEAHGGEIEVESSPAGTTFTVTLPAEPPRGASVTPGDPP